MLSIFIFGYIILVIIIIYQQIQLNNKLLSYTGIPISLKFPVSQNLENDKNYFLCVSLDCTQCQNIIAQLLQSSIKRKDITLIFMNDQMETIKYLNENFININENIKILSNYTQEELFIDIKPFAYLLNNEGIIINKRPFNKLKQINIEIDK